MTCFETASKYAANSRFVPLRIFAHIQRKKIKSKYGPWAANPWTKIKVNPKDINRYRSRGYESIDEYWKKGGRWRSDSEQFDRWLDAGEVYNGDWDRQTLELTKLPKFVGMKEHIIHNIPWKETKLFDYYRNILDQEETISIDGCSSENELLNRYKNIDNIIQDIKKRGYQPRTDLCMFNTFRCVMHEIVVSIGRDGSYIFGDGGGWHRLSIARIFDIDAIPVRVLVRHQNWHELRKKMYSSDGIADIQQKGQEDSLHPDLRNFSK